MSEIACDGAPYRTGCNNSPKFIALFFRALIWKIEEKLTTFTELFIPIHTLRKKFNKFEFRRKCPHSQELPLGRARHHNINFRLRIHSVTVELCQIVSGRNFPKP